MVHQVHADTYAAGGETRLRYDRWVTRESKRQAADWTNHLKNIDALADRQERFLTTGVRWAAAHSGRTCRVILPAPDPSSGSIVMDSVAALSTSEHPWHPRWAQGVAIGISADEVVAVLCPVASQIDRDPGLRRRLSGVAVLTTSSAEYDRLARALPKRTHPVRLETEATVTSLPVHPRSGTDE
jgi:hypothetical protein